MISKRCGKCTEEKCINDFYKGKKYIDSYCKICRRISSNRYRDNTKPRKKQIEPREKLLCFSCKKEFLALKKRRTLNAYCSKECRYGGSSFRYRFKNEIENHNVYDDANWF